MPTHILTDFKKLDLMSMHIHLNVSEYMSAHMSIRMRLHLVHLHVCMQVYAFVHRHVDAFINTRAQVHGR